MKSTPKGNAQLTDIFLLFAEVHLMRPMEADDLAGPIHHMLYYNDKQPLPLPVFGSAVGRMEYRYRHVDLIIPVLGYDIALCARLKAHGEYAVCRVYPKAEGKARHQQIEELASIIETRSIEPERQDALWDALSRAGGHWERALLARMDRERDGKHAGVVQGSLV